MYAKGKQKLPYIQIKKMRDKRIAQFISHFIIKGLL